MPHRAIEEYRCSISIEPMARAYNNLGVVYDNLRDVPASLEAHRKAILVDPNYVAAYCNLGKRLWDSGQQAEALLLYRKAVDLDPSFPCAVNGLAFYLAGLQQWEEAVYFFEKAQQLDADFEDVHINLARAYVQINQNEDALRNFRAHLQKHRRDYRAWSDMGFCYLISEAQAPNPSYRYAIRCFLKSLTINPVRRMTYFGLLVAMRAGLK